MDLQLRNVDDCPICGERSRRIAKTKTINAASGEEVDLLKCVGCSHWWHSPMPSQVALSSLYASESSYVLGPNAKESYASDTNSDSPFRRFVLGACEPSNGLNYLEIGPGGGELMREFRRRGYQSLGVDPGQWVPDSQIMSSIDDLPTAMRFSIFVLQDVLEHVVAPIDLLRDLRSRAAPRARLFFSVPWSESRPARLLRARWPMVRPFGHLHYFSHDSAHVLLARSGWYHERMIMSATTPVLESMLRFELKSVIYYAVKGGKDQLFVSGRMSE